MHMYFLISKLWLTNSKWSIIYTSKPSNPSVTFPLVAPVFHLLTQPSFPHSASAAPSVLLPPLCVPLPLWPPLHCALPRALTSHNRAVARHYFKLCFRCLWIYLMLECKYLIWCSQIFLKFKKQNKIQTPVKGWHLGFSKIRSFHRGTLAFQGGRVQTLLTYISWNSILLVSFFMEYMFF